MYHNYVLNFRLSKENIKLFGDEVNEKNKKSTFIRTLINQYACLPKDQRIYLLFSEIYALIGNCIDENSWVELSLVNNNSDVIYPIDIETCPINSQIYIIGIDEELQIFSVRLCDIIKVQRTKNTNNKIDLSRYKKRLKQFYVNFEYIDFSTKLIEGE